MKKGMLYKSKNEPLNKQCEFETIYRFLVVIFFGKDCGKYPILIHPLNDLGVGASCEIIT